MSLSTDIYDEIKKVVSQTVEKGGFSQLGQDIYLIEDVYKYKRDGFFVEIGALDGITASNTYLLEKSYDWKGICVEPHPAQFELLKQNRKCVCVNSPVYSANDELVEFDLKNPPATSGIKKTINYDNPNFITENTILMKTKTLTDILNENSAPTHIDYLSIDTEGSELEILKGVDFDKYNFGYITVEHNYVEPQRSQIKEFLKNKKYIQHRQNLVDDDYITLKNLKSK